MDERDQLSTGSRLGETDKRQREPQSVDVPAPTLSERDLDALPGRIERAIARIMSGGAPMRIPRDMTDADIVLNDCRHAIAALRARAEQAEADAERYRFLRTKARIEPSSREGPEYCRLSFEWDYDCWPRPPAIGNVDAAIDRARSQGLG